MSIDPSIPEIQNFLNLTLKIQGEGEMTMMAQLQVWTIPYNFEWFKSIPAVSEIWLPQSLAQVLPHLTSFRPWANPYGGNGQITITMHNYKSGQVHKTLNGLNPSSGFKKSAFHEVWTQFVPNLTSFWSMGKPIWGKWPRQCGQFHRSLNGENPSSGWGDMSSSNLAAARSPGPWRQYPSSTEGWGVKTDCITSHVLHIKSRYQVGCMWHRYENLLNSPF